MRAGGKAALAFAVALLAACASDGSAPVAPAPAVAETPAAPAPSPVETPRAEAPAPSPASSAAAGDGSFTRYLAALSDVSCPAGVKREASETIGLTAKPVPLQALNASRRQVGELNFVGGFQLSSPDKRFGGLSGIDVLDDGNLLAISDQGDFVWIDLGGDGLTPKAARISTMHDAKGELLQGKTDGDAEGLAVNGGTALVSYERNHRVLAFDLGECGAAARGAPIVFGAYGEPLPQAFSDAKADVDANQGPEPLAVTRDWYLFTGIETKVGGESLLSARPIEARPEFGLRVGGDAPEFVGLDVLETGRKGRDVRAFSLHRSFSPLAGNAITIVETYFARELDQASPPARIAGEIDERSRYRFKPQLASKLAELNILFNIDNFEGIAAKELPDGRVRLYVMSDDNFSPSQRTLLFVFDIAKG